MAGEAAALLNPSASRAVGGWKTIPFISVTGMGVGIGGFTVIANLGVYLMQQYNILPVDSTVLTGIFAGSTNLAPLIGSFISDTCSGCFPVIAAACAASALGMLIFTLTAALPSLRPPPCSPLGPCKGPTPWQYTVLYTAAALVTIGQGGTRYTIATMGAEQLNNSRDRETFFSLCTVLPYVTSVIAIAGVVYIQDKMGYALGFGLCTVLSIFGLVVFLLGRRFYCYPRPRKNRLSEMFGRAISRMKSKFMGRCGGSEPYGVLEDEPSGLTLSSKENFTIIIRLIPLIATGTVLNIYTAMQIAISIIQALAMDLHIAPSFSIPLGSLTLLLVFAVTISIPALEYILYPAYRALTGKTPTPLQLIGVGFLFTTLAMVYGAVMEARRLEALQESAVPWSVWQLFPIFMLVGFGEAMYFPGQLAFFYQEFPDSLKGSGMAIGALQSGIGSYLSSAILALLRRVTGWVDDDANKARLDNAYWALAVVGVLNLVVFVVSAREYEKKRGRKI